MGTSAAEVVLLGRFEVRREGAPVPWSAFGGRQAQRLVRYLASSGGAYVTRDQLIEALWGANLPADPDANLNVVVTRARHALGSPSTIETRPGGYALSPEVTADVDGFVAAAEAAARTDTPEARVAAHRAALSLWTGEPLVEDRYADWARASRERLLQVRQEALERGAEAALEVGDTVAAVTWARDAVAQQPLREVSCLLLVRALAAGGDLATALTEYDALRSRLAEELGIDPSPQAQALHVQLLHQAPSVVGPSSPLGPPPFVGRGPELARLQRTSLPGSVVVVRGPAGGGKSRLLAEVRARSGLPSLVARAVQPEQSAPWSLARRLARAALDLGADPAELPPRVRSAVADLVPDLGAEEVALDAESRRVLVLDGVRRLLTGSTARLLVVDDLQWADASSLDLLTLLAAEPSLSLMIACRSGEELTEPVRGLLDQLRAARCTEVALGPLAPAEVAQLVADHELANVVSDLTDGTPFEVLQVLDELSRNRVVRREPTGWVRVDTTEAASEVARAAAAEGRRQAVASRLASHTAEARRLMAVVALLDRPAPDDLLARGSGIPDPTPALHQLVGAGLVRRDPAGWATAHDLVGEAVRDQLGPAERATLHRSVADALGPGSAVAAERAHHLSGGGDPAGAATAYADAARGRLDACADDEALTLCEAGLLLEPDDETRRVLLEVRAEGRRRAGDRSGTRADLRSALSLATTPADRSRLLAALAQHASGGDDMARAEQLAELAIVEAATEPSARAHALRVAAIVDMNLDRPDRADERYAEALRLFRESGNAAGVVEVLDARAMASFMRGEVLVATDDLARVAGVFEDLGRLFRVVQPLSTAGHGSVFQDCADEGLKLTQRALELARSLGDREGTSFALWHGSEALAALGEVAPALAWAQEALEIAIDIGHRGWTATGHRAVGVAHLAAGDLDAAEQAFLASLGVSHNLPLFGSWARSRLAMVANARRDHLAARELAEQALRLGPPLAHHEARLALAEAALGQGSADAAELVQAALDGERAGFRVGLEALRTSGARPSPPE